MDVLAIADQYYDAWIHHAGDMTDVPLAADLTFTGPVASFRTADGYRAMARKAGAAVRGFRVRHRFVTGQTVCSIIDWENRSPLKAGPPPAPATDGRFGRPPTT
ncbi:SnoaL-like domain-containing protein [Actinomadura madurae]|uniref:SnoaL-like domain-containing protein n=1 Tax=Actinomadura madurae TaxID=1993 RepID=A0A1I5GPP0_9ACTN|nr:SnoaL-like domain-containing protein [Actinomadura madurae]